MASTYAGILGFAAFSVVLARETLQSGSIDAAMVQGVMCLFGFAAIGYLIGWAAELIVADSVRVQIAKEIAEAESMEASRSTD